ncbi:MAG TPA: GntR family transcriptional regulator [Anaerolineae bacterium]|nr:GntR family transcriptional regulator [Anaerolineae bacterium]MCB0222936.1 GntR family transcriptional regulator [Anaerolineae bacterium]MCB9108058.1 GntR family transcriptional regulator [Anaerolineales bacterium]HRV92185.1 GntR family transcriptional regulator [Anaerolineae bacterium]
MTVDGMSKLEDYLSTKGKIDGSNSRLLREAAYERLYEAIKHAQLQPGEPLSETRLSKALGISRTPVREALQRLAKEGLVQVIPGRAITIAAPSIQDVFDAIHVRELLEPELVRLAAEAMPTEEKTKMLSLTHEMDRAAKAGDRPRWSKADIKWHETLCNACPNHLLGEMVMQARNRIFTQAADEHVPEQYLIEGTAEHLQIVQAILNGEGEKAKQITLDHIRNVRENMVKRFFQY